MQSADLGPSARVVTLEAEARQVGGSDTDFAP
jgi:hypothetical protein